MSKFFLTVSNQTKIFKFYKTRSVIFFNREGSYPGYCTSYSMVNLRNAFANYTCSLKPTQMLGITKKDAVSKRDDISLKNSSYTYDLIAGLFPSL